MCHHPAGIKWAVKEKKTWHWNKSTKRSIILMLHKDSDINCVKKSIFILTSPVNMHLYSTSVWPFLSSSYCLFHVEIINYSFTLNIELPICTKADSQRSQKTKLVNIQIQWRRNVMLGHLNKFSFLCQYFLHSETTLKALLGEENC